MNPTRGVIWRPFGKRPRRREPSPRGEIRWSELPEIGRRPGVVLSRDAAIPRLRRTIIAACTTTVRGLPSEVVLDPERDPVPRRCAVNLDSVEGVSVATLVQRLGRVSDPRMSECALR